MIPTELKEARKRLNLSQQQMAVALGFEGEHAARRVRRLESGDLLPTPPIVAHVNDLLTVAYLKKCTSCLQQQVEEAGGWPEKLVFPPPQFRAEEQALEEFKKMLFKK